MAIPASNADERTPELIPGVEHRALPIGPEEAFVLSRIDGRATQSDISSATGLDDQQVRSVLDRLVVLGAVRFPIAAAVVAPGGAKGTASAGAAPGEAAVQRPGGASKLERPAVEAVLARFRAEDSIALYDPSELDEPCDLEMGRRRAILDIYYRLEELDHYELLDVAGSADKSEIKAAYFRIVGLFHPDKYFGKELGGFKPKLERVFARLTEAHDTLTRKKTRQEYDEYLSTKRRNRALERALYGERALRDELEKAQQRIIDDARLAERRSRVVRRPAMDAPPRPDPRAEPDDAPPPPARESPVHATPRTQVAGSPPDASRPDTRARPAQSPPAASAPEQPRPPPASGPSQPRPPASAPQASPMPPPAPQSPRAAAPAPSPPPPAPSPPPPAPSPPPPAPSPAPSRPPPGPPGGTARISVPPPGGDDARRRAFARRVASSKVPPSIPPAPPAPGQAEVQRQVADELKRVYTRRVGQARDNQVLLYLNAADEALSAGNPVSAANALRVAASLAPQDEDIQKRLAAAEQAANVKLADSFLEQAQYEEKESRWEEAAQSYLRAALGKPSARVHERVAFCLLKAQGDPRIALDHAKRAVALSPHQTAVRVTLAQAYLRAGMRQSAIAEFERAQAQAPQDDTIRDWLKRIRRNQV